MSSGVFVLKEDGSLVEMNQKDYDSEDILQELLAKYPNLLSGNLINETDPRKWILVSREYSVPDNETLDSRWSVDHLFLDQDGVPTLVEVKRSNDTRIRREVVGQMLEYAANAVSYWKIEKIRVHYEANCERLGLDPLENWVSCLGVDSDYNLFWESVSNNLQSGKIRMLFVSDEIPLELRRIVEFLNEQMNPAEVLALEIKQYVGQTQRTLIPRVYGQSSKLQLRKAVGGKSKQWDEESFLAELREREDSDVAQVAVSILDWCKRLGLRCWYGYGARSGSCFPVFDCNGKSFWMFSMWTYGRIEVQFQHMRNQSFLNDDESKLRLLNNLNQIPGVSIPVDGINRRPSIPLNVLQSKESLEVFFGVWEDYFSDIIKHFNSFS